jgi:hypothetical protein
MPTVHEKAIAQELAETAALLARAAERLSRVAQRLAEKPAPIAPQQVAGEVYLTTKEAAEALKMSCKGLERMRAEKLGPPYLRIGKAVRYPRSRLHENTGECMVWRK